MKQTYALSLRRALLLGMGASLIIATKLWADPSLETMDSFNGDNGSEPGALLQLPDGTFCGTTTHGGSVDLGTIFIIGPNKPLQTLVTFDNGNGCRPSPRIVLSDDGYLFGTTKGGGAYGHGTLYRLSPNGNFQTMVSFNQDTGIDPQADLVVDHSGTVYGCTTRGGTEDKGTLFAVGPDHKIKTLVNFSDDKGVAPQGLNLGADGRMYGATASGGDYNCGTVFAISNKGEFTKIASFQPSNSAGPFSRILSTSNGDLFGTSTSGGVYGLGTLCRISSQGAVERIHSFDEDMGAHPGTSILEWYDGYFYMRSLVNNLRRVSTREQWDGMNLYGTTTDGGEYGNGTIFRITQDRKVETIVTFTGTKGNNLGAAPNSLLAGADGNLYGTTNRGGPHDRGTVYQLRLTIAPPPPVGGLAVNDYRPLPQNELPVPPAMPIVSH